MFDRVSPGAPMTGFSEQRLARLAEIDPRPEVLSYDIDQLEAVLSAWLEARSERSYRTSQTIDWIYRQQVNTWREMTNLPTVLREGMTESFRFPSVEPGEIRESNDGTQKFLWNLIDGESIESVLIPFSDRDTVCISSQAGCALACTFCATGKFGFRRNLTAGEMVDQVRRLIRLRDRDDVGVNVVFMGMGEPLLNWENVRTALTTMIDARGLDIGARRITVSTVGYPEKIAALAEMFPQVRLAVSLHAARDDVRDEIVPLNRRYPVRELMAACRVWQTETGKILTFEYIHLPEVNDRPEDIEAMSRALRGLRAKINLMRYNPIDGAQYRRPADGETEHFRDRLAHATGTKVTVRKSRGLDIEGACGQLRLARGWEVIGPGPVSVGLSVGVPSGGNR